MTIVTIKGGVYFDTNESSASARGTPYHWLPGKLEPFRGSVPLREHDISFEADGQEPPEWFTAPWPLPPAMTREEYERSAIADAGDDDDGYEVDAAGTAKG